MTLFVIKKTFKVYRSFKTKKKYTEFLVLCLRILYMYCVYSLRKVLHAFFLISDQQYETGRTTAKLFKLRIILLDRMPLLMPRLVV